MSNKTIFIFGDSITQGYWDPKGGWAQYLREELNNITLETDFEDYYSVHLLGISGNTSKDILERIESEIKVRTNNKSEIILLISIGVNDSQFIKEKESHEINPEEFKENLNNLIEIGNKFNAKIIFLESTPVIDDMLNPCPFRIESTFHSKFIEKYEKIKQKVCKENKLHLIPIYKELSNNQEFLEELKKIDGLHPNTKGHKMIYKIIKDYLTKNSILNI